jgi:hypothetical protein
MPFELDTILSLITGILLTMLVFYLYERIGERKKNPDEEKRQQRIAITEGLIWLAPVINHLQKCVLLAKDFDQQYIGEEDLKKSWPQINLKELGTETGRKTMPWLPPEIFHRGMALIARLEYNMQLYPDILIKAQKTGKEQHNTFLSHIENLSALQKEFQELDKELRQRFFDILH